MVGGGLSGRLSLAWSVVGSDRGSFLPGSTACVSTDHACSDRPPTPPPTTYVPADHLLLDRLLGCGARSTTCASTDQACSDRPPVFGAGSAVLTSTDHLLLDGPLVACPTAAFA